MITWEDYMKITEMIMLRLLRGEEENQEGVKKSEVIQWYLEEKEQELQSIEEMEEQKALIKKVIKKLVKVNFTREICYNEIKFSFFLGTKAS
jgi:DNA replication licensing factor MCM6